MVTEEMSGSGAPVQVPLVVLRGVTKRFGAVQALTAVDFEVPSGQVTALVGDNGAGKSVLIKTLSGLFASWPYGGVGCDVGFRSSDGH